MMRIASVFLALLVSPLLLTAQTDFQDFTLSGQVPADAHIAIVAFRANTECNCPSSYISVFLANASYSEPFSSNKVPNSDFSNGLTGWSDESGIPSDGRVVPEPVPGGGGQGLRISVTASQSLILNGSYFDVTPGAPYQAVFRAR